MSEMESNAAVEAQDDGTLPLSTPAADLLTKAARQIASARGYAALEPANKTLEGYERHLLRLADKASPLPTVYGGRVAHSGIETRPSRSKHIARDADFVLYVGPGPTKEEVLEFLQIVSQQIRAEGVWRAERAAKCRDCGGFHENCEIPF